MHSVLFILNYARQQFRELQIWEVTQNQLHLIMDRFMDRLYARK